MADIAAKEFALWIQPRDAIRQVARQFGDAGNAALALFGRLKDGILVAAAEQAESHGVYSNFKVIPPDHWKALDKIQSGASVWQSGDILIETRSGQSVVSIGYHGIRLDPLQVKKLIGSFSATAGPVEPPSPAVDAVALEVVVAEIAPPEPIILIAPAVEPPVQHPLPLVPAKAKTTPVSKLHLKAWYDAYRSVYGGTPVDTPAFALQSAQGMFPDREVSRRLVREIAATRSAKRKHALSSDARNGAGKPSRTTGSRKATREPRRRP